MFHISEAARFLRISNPTLRRWDKSGKLKAKRTHGNQRWYSKEQLLSFLGLGEEEFIQAEQRKKSTKITYLYARVSSYRQKKIGGLDRQTERLKNYCEKNYGKNQTYKIIKECGSGLNSERRGLKKLIRDIRSQKVERVLITYKDRLTRFGYSFLEVFFEEFGVKIIEVEMKDLISIEEQLVIDMMSLVASFSGIMYKIRSLREKKLTKETMKTNENIKENKK